MSEDLDKWTCRLAQLPLERGSWYLLRVGTHPALDHSPRPTHLLTTRRYCYSQRKVPFYPPDSSFHLTPPSPPSREGKVQDAGLGRRNRKALITREEVKPCSLFTWEPPPGAQRSWPLGGGGWGGLGAEGRTGGPMSGAHCSLTSCTATWRGRL